jgi:hypothetical protein
MWRWPPFWKIQYLQPRPGGLQARALEFVDVGHEVSAVREAGLATIDRSYRHRRPSHASQIRSRRAAALPACPCPGCGSFTDEPLWLARHALPGGIVQGNSVQAAGRALKAGMSRLQVRDILGTRSHRCVPFDR